MVLTKRPGIHITVQAGRRYYSARPASPDPTNFQTTDHSAFGRSGRQKLVTSFLVGANARYHSRSPFQISVFSFFPMASPSRHLRLVGDRRERRTHSRRAKYRHG